MHSTNNLLLKFNGQNNGIKKKKKCLTPLDFEKISWSSFNFSKFVAATYDFFFRQFVWVKSTESRNLNWHKKYDKNNKKELKTIQNN